MLLYDLFKQPCVIYLSFPYFPLGYCLTQLEHIPPTPPPHTHTAPASYYHLSTALSFPSLHGPFMLSFLLWLLQLIHWNLKVGSLDPWIRGNTWHSPFWTWVTTLRVIFSSSRHLPATIVISLSFQLNRILLYMCSTFSSSIYHLSMSRLFSFPIYCE